MAVDLVSAIRFGTLVEAGPAGLAIIRSARVGADTTIAIQHSLGLADERIFDACADERAAAAHALRVDTGFVIGVAGIFQCAHNPAGRRAADAANGCAHRGRCEPTRGNDRSEARNGQESETGEQPADPTDRRRVRIETTPTMWELTGPLLGPFIQESQLILDDYSTEELERFAEFLRRVIDVQAKYTERIREM